MGLAISLPLLCLCLLVLLLRQGLIKQVGFVHWPHVILLSTVVWGIWVVFITEFLSQFKLLSLYPLVGSWVILSFVLLILGYRLRMNIWTALPPPSYSPFQLILVLVIIFFIVATAGIGLVSAPNNWDSMTYHLVRVVHWLQNSTVNHYATHFLPQLFNPIWSEIVMAHLYLLYGNDQWTSWVQWASMVGCVLGVFHIARLMGADRTGRLLAGVVVVTIPMGILQAVSTQNDYVVTFWLICTTVFVMEFHKTGYKFNMWAMAGSVALAVQTKGTAYFYILPLLIWAFVEYFKRYRWQTWQLVVMVGLVVVLVNGNHYLRNLSLFGTPLVSGHDGYSYAVQTFELPNMVSNLARNLALHLTTPVPEFNNLVENAIIQAHTWLGVSPNDPLTTWAGTQFSVPPAKVDESLSGNFVHLMLIVAASIMLVVRRNFGLQFIYSAVLIMGFMLFAAFTTWQPWHSRLHLPFFVLWSPLIGLMLSQLRYQTLAVLIIVLLVMQATPFLLRNPLHPVLSRHNIFNIPRTSQYFLGNPGLEEPFTQMLSEVVNAKCSQLGVILPINSWEYPFWVLSEQMSPVAMRIHALEVKNQSKALSDPAFQPCAVICLQCEPANFQKYTQLMGNPQVTSGLDLLFLKTAD